MIDDALDSLQQAYNEAQQEAMQYAEYEPSLQKPPDYEPPDYDPDDYQ